MVRRVTFALFRGGEARSRARLDHRTHDAEIRLGLPRDDPCGGLTRVGTVGAEPDDAGHLPHVLLGKAGIGAGGTTRAAVQALLDAAQKNVAISVRRMWMQPDDLLKRHATLLLFGAVVVRKQSAPGGVE